VLAPLSKNLVEVGVEFLDCTEIDVAVDIENPDTYILLMNVFFRVADLDAHGNLPFFQWVVTWKIRSG
jgi:hypothetical protein